MVSKFLINDYELCIDTQELKHRGCVLKTEPLLLKLLTYFLQHSNSVISYDELLKNVWGARVVSNSTINAAVSATRTLIGDSGKKQSCIKTVSGRGYRFVAQFETLLKQDPPQMILQDQALQHSSQKQLSQKQRAQTLFFEKLKPAKPSSEETSSEETSSEEQSAIVSYPNKPSLAVMNFIDTGDSEQSARFATAMTIDINAALSRLPNFFVTARVSSAKVSSMSLTALEISQRLGVRYLVFGRSHRLDNKFKITLSIVQGESESEIWAEHYESSIDDLFLAEQKITEKIIASIDSTIEQAEIDRVFSFNYENLNTWDLYHRGLRYINQTKEADLRRAQALFDQALAIDPHFSRAQAGLAYLHTNYGLLCADVNSQTDFARATEYAHLSIANCYSDPIGHFALSRILLFTKDYFDAGQIVDRIICSHPSYARAYFSKTLICAFNEQDSEIEKHIDNAHQLSPLDPLQFSLKLSYAMSLISRGDYERAAKWSVSAANEPNAWSVVYVLASACLYIVGNKKRAQVMMAKALKHQPNYHIAHYQRLFQHKNEQTNNLIINAIAAVKQLS